ncbi:MAG: hypothetical protein O2901_14105 [Verrucomicrobia bacterium]|nr:hypothetical protein [Verrucomicrobiota bacterium]
METNMRMKMQITIGSLGLLLGGVMLSDGMAQDPAATEDANAILVVKTEQPVKVDGVLDEDCWKTAVPIKADYIKGGDNEFSAEPRMIAKYAWDDQYLYIGYETFDKNLVANGNGVTKGPADNRREGCEISSPADVVEFFVGFDDPHMFWEIHHSASNHINDILVFVDLPAWKEEPPAMVHKGIYWAKNETIQDAGEHKLMGASQVKPRADGKPSTINDDTDADTGYTAEMRFPWAGIGAPGSGREGAGWGKMAGRDITILAVTEDGDSKDQPYHTSCGTLPKNDFFHHHVAAWPRYKLAAEAPVK